MMFLLRSHKIKIFALFLSGVLSGGNSAQAIIIYSGVVDIAIEHESNTRVFMNLGGVSDKFLH